MAILLKILSVIGVILLVILALLLALILIVLLVPVRYKTVTAKHGGTLRVQGQASWLLHFVRIPFRAYVDGLEKTSSGKRIKTGYSWEFRVLGFVLKSASTEDDTDVKETKSEKDVGTGPAEADTAEGDTIRYPDTEKSIGYEQEKDRKTAEVSGTAENQTDGSARKESYRTDLISCKDAEPQQPVEKKSVPHPDKERKPYNREEAARRSREGAKRKPTVQPGEKRDTGKEAEIPIEIIPAKRPGKFEMLLAAYGAKIGHLKKAAARGQSILSVVLAWLDYADSDSFEHAISVILREVKALLKHMLPRTITGNIAFGMGEPDLTGEILAGIAVFYPVLPPRLAIVPDFGEEKLEADIQAAGRIRLAAVLWRVLKLILTRDVRDLISRIRAKSPEDPVLRRAREKEKKAARRKAARKKASSRRKRQKRKKCRRG